MEHNRYLKRNACSAELLTVTILKHIRFELEKGNKSQKYIYIITREKALKTNRVESEDFL